jgi:hypothetical protein
MPVTFSVRRCYSEALSAFGDNVVWLGILNGAFFLLDRATAVTAQQDPTGWVGNVASLVGMLVTIAYVTISVVVTYRLAAKLPLDRSVWRASVAIGPAMFRLVLLCLMLIALVGIPCYMGLAAMVHDEQLASRWALPVVAVMLMPLMARCTFSFWYVAEGLKVRPALRDSWRLTEGHLVKIVLITLPMLVGFGLFSMAIGHGVWEHLVTWLQNMVLYPLMNLASAFAFFRLRGQTDSNESVPGLAPIQPT